MLILLVIMRKLLISILTIMCIVVIASCSNDDTDSIPSYRTDILCALTNSDSLVTDIQFDNGRSYHVASQHIRSRVPNASIRCYSSFEITEDSTSVKIYDIKQISCYTPLPADSFKIHPQDPVNVTSVWKSGNYINLCIAPLVSAIKDFHYDFCIDSITDSKGKTLIHTSLLYQRAKNGSEYYTQKFYHSIPLASNGYPCPFDSLYLYINTYEGIKTYTFAR